MRAEDRTPGTWWSRSRDRVRAVLVLTAALALVAAILVPVVKSVPAFADAGCGAACTSVSSDPKTLAGELVSAANAGNFTEATITTGSIIQNELVPIAAGNVSPQCNIDYRVLQTLVVTLRSYGNVQVTDLNRWCANDGKHTCGVAGSSPWHCAQPAIAIDFGRIGGQVLDGSNAASIGLLRLLNSFLPSNMHVGQLGCAGRPSLANNYGFSNLGREFTDSCNHVHIDFGYASGTLRVTPPASQTPPPAPTGFKSVLGPGDFSGDGKADLLGVTQDGVLRLYAGDGYGHFTASTGTQIGVSWGAFKQILGPADFDGDKKPDLLAITTDGALRLYSGNGSGGFLAATGRVIGSSWADFKTVTGPGDFDGDGKNDLLAVTTDGALRLYAGNGTGGFLASTGKVIGSSWNQFVRVLGPGDFDGDGKNDLLAVTTDGALRLYPGNGTGGFLASTGTVIGAGWAGFRSVNGPGDFDGDGKADMLAVAFDGTLTIYSGDGAGGFLRSIPLVIGSSWQNYPSVVTTPDFDGDGNSDILATTSSGDLLLYRGSGTGRFLNGAGGTRIGSSFGQYKQILTPGDFDGDGKSDLLALKSDGTLYLWAGNGAGGFKPGTGVLIGSSFNTFTQIVTPGDFSGDGLADLLTLKSDGTLLLYKGDGTGHFLNGSGGTVIGSAFNTFVRILPARDIDGDGKVDIIGVRPNGDLRVFLGNGSGGFRNGSAPLQGGRGWTGFASILDPIDFTGDGRPDMLTIRKDGTLTLWAGNDSREFLTSYSAVIGVGW